MDLQRDFRILFVCSFAKNSEQRSSDDRLHEETVIETNHVLAHSTTDRADIHNEGI